MEQNAAQTAPLIPSNDGDAKAQALKKFAETSSGNASIYEQLSSNPFFTAGFGLAGLGAALRLGQTGLRRGAELLRRRMLVDLEITRHDESYQWVLNWMTRQYQIQLSNNTADVGRMESLVRRFTPGLHHLQIKTASIKTPGGASQTHFSLVPGHGRHILRYRNAFIAVSREREGKSFDHQGQPFETIKLTTLYGHRHIFEEIFEEAHLMSLQSVEGKTVVYTLRNMQWQPMGDPKRKRPFDSVVLAEGLAEHIRDDVQEFLDARTWYLDRGIPYRRGYLLTRFQHRHAQSQSTGLNDDLLNHLLLNLPPRTIVLLEDADAAFSNRRQTEGDGYSGATVTFSGLLNALDGVASAEERVIFMTTNHIDRLDEALIRPGRVDMTVRLGEATEWQIEQMWDRFYAQLDPDGTKKQAFMKRARESGSVDSVSTAALQGLFLYNKDDADGAIAMVDQLAPKKVTEGKSS
ncbi:Complex III assembly protein translocase and chaperone [Taxawa tesnikishii (nom. ined.)]|nr:Complex III assembly protein translocase and chaperone [Dothideales sp. JES 119]